MVSRSSLGGSVVLLVLVACDPSKPTPGDDSGDTAGTPVQLDDCDDDDADPDVYDRATEVCNGVDDDCDGLIDADDDSLDDRAAAEVYADADGDGLGDASVRVVTCEPVDGWVYGDGDLDDADAGSGGVADPRDVTVSLDLDPRDVVGAGWFMTPLGDLDGDGFSEVLSGAPAVVYVDGDGMWQASGAASVWSGPGGAEPSQHAVAIEQADAWFGASGANLGDLDGDGLDDVALSAPFTDTNYRWCWGCYTEAGEIRLFSGAASGTFDPLVSVSADALGGAAPGFWLAAAPDVDGDGLAELVSANAEGFGRGQSDVDFAYVYSGTSLTLMSAGGLAAGAEGDGVLATWTSTALHDALARAGDLTGDGVDELATAVDGAAAIVSLDAADGALEDVAAAWIVDGAGGTPTGVADGGDLDGDGLSDLVVASADHSDGAATVGAVWIVPGGTAGAVDASSLSSWVGASADDVVSGRVSAAFDLDLDGRGDLAAGGARGGADGVWVWLAPEGGGTTDDAWLFIETSHDVLAFTDRPMDADGDGAEDLLFAQGAGVTTMSLDRPEHGAKDPDAYTGVGMQYWSVEGSLNLYRWP